MKQETKEKFVRLMTREITPRERAIMMPIAIGLMMLAYVIGRLSRSWF